MSRVNPRWMRNAFVAITVALMAALGGILWSSYRNFERALTIDFRIMELRGKIVYLDEVLTMSARMAVATGELAWEERYQRFVVELDEAIGEVKETAPLAFSEFAVQTDDANKILVEMENRAFDYLKQGLQEEAAAILFSESYESQKTLYAAGMEVLSDRLLAQRVSLLTTQRRVAVIGMGQVLLATLVLVSLWAGYARVLRRIHAQTEEHARKLERLNADQERLINERTDELRTALGELGSRNTELESSLEMVNQLSGLLPICAHCKNVRNDDGYWQQVESYISEKSEAQFSHSICPVCVEKLYPELL